MADPFGMAYGIGAGLAGVPGAIQQGREERMKLAMNALALQQAQKQQEMEDATNEAMTQDYPVPEQAPVTIQTPAIASRIDATNADAGPSMSPELAEQRNVGIGAKTKTIQPMPNPNVITAHKMLLQAEALQKIGNWRVAQQLRDHAMTYGEKGMKEVRQQFGQMVAGGMFDQAVSALHGMGIQNVVGITPSDDGTSIVLHKDDGTSFDMDEEALAKFTNPDATAKSGQELLLKREQLALKREELARKVSQGDRRLDISQKNMELRDALGWAKLSMERNRAALGGPKTPAKILQWQYEAAQEKRLNPDLSDAEIWRIVRARDEKGQLSMGTAVRELRALADNMTGPEAKQIYADTLKMINSSKVVKAAKGGKAGDGEPKKVNSKEERDALAPGTKYIAPDGSIRTR
jgi:hypothetical protein